MWRCWGLVAGNLSFQMPRPFTCRFSLLALCRAISQHDCLFQRMKEECHLSTVLSATSCMQMLLSIKISLFSCYIDRHGWRPKGCWKVDFHVLGKKQIKYKFVVGLCNLSELIPNRCCTCTVANTETPFGNWVCIIALFLFVLSLTENLTQRWELFKKMDRYFVTLCNYVQTLFLIYRR